MEQIARLVKIIDRQLLYENVLYVDANSRHGSDSNIGSKDAPFLTIAAAVAAAHEYTTIVCVDSRVGALAVGFDENAAVTGVTIATNYITIVGYSPNWVQGHKVFVTNSIDGADNVFNITADHVILIGLVIYLQDINGDEITVLCSGDSLRMDHCDLPNYIPGDAQNECIRVTGNNPVLDYVHTMLSNVGFRFSGSMARVRHSTFQGATEDGIMLDATAIDAYIDSCQFQACGDGIHVTAGATYNSAYECNFANCTTNWNNLGGVNNQLIHAKIESQITAGNEEEQDLKDIFDAVAMVITTIATLASQTSFTLTAGAADNDAYNGMIAVIEDASTATQKAIGVISDYVGASKTITLREDPGIFAMAAADKIAIIAVSPDIAAILGLIDTAEATGPFTYLNVGGEQDVYEDTATTRRKISIELDLNTMTQDGTIRVKRKVDGANYRTWIEHSFSAAGAEKVWTVSEAVTNQAFKVTYEEAVDETADRDIEYNVITQVME